MSAPFLPEPPMCGPGSTTICTGKRLRLWLKTEEVVIRVMATWARPPTDMQHTDATKRLSMGSYESLSSLVAGLQGTAHSLELSQDRHAQRAAQNGRALPCCCPETGTGRCRCCSKHSLKKSRPNKSRMESLCAACPREHTWPYEWSQLLPLLRAVNCEGNSKLHIALRSLYACT